MPAAALYTFIAVTWLFCIGAFTLYTIGRGDGAALVVMLAALFGFAISHALITPLGIFLWELIQDALLLPGRENLHL